MLFRTHGQKPGTWIENPEFTGIHQQVIDRTLAPRYSRTIQTDTIRREENALHAFLRVQNL